MKKKSELIQFEVLKILNNTPTYGYDLFLILSENGIIQKSSYLYKILRFMKNNGLVQGDTNDSSNGPNRIILTLTQKGKELYYSNIIESASFFYGLIFDRYLKISVTLCHEIFRKRGYDSKKFEGKNCFISFPDEYTFENQITTIYSFFIPFNINLNLYVNPLKIQNYNIDFFFKRTKINVKQIDMNLEMKPQSMDFIFVIGRKIFPEFKNNIEKYQKFLKKKGVFCLALENKEEYSRPNIVNDLIIELLQNSPEKYKNQLKSFLPLDIHSNYQTINNKEIMTLLYSLFNNVEIEENKYFVDIIIAQSLKE
ncbi:MAG: PadR family transcriptional regulator [Candidatus Lokiarchaeota archaeon]|nr:PadR family transcriptional regulator [Candidatus Lokiarchaeota archaeon]